LAAAGLPAVIAQRCDDFRSPQFQWLSAAIRQASRPLDRRAFTALTAAFNRWFDADLRAELIVSEAEGSSRVFLEEWALSVPKAITDTTGQAAAALAHGLTRDPGRFRSFIDQAIALFPADDDTTSDIAEDRAAWHDLFRSIGQTIGRDAPLEPFLEELAIRSKEPPVGADTVTLMTIHGAKGKEFDHVYVIGLAEDVLPSFQSLKAGEASAEMEEERRNCFVAITRARECLRLSYADCYRNWSKRPSRFLAEMGFDLPPLAE
jgi:DNA helicase-2/ATP-dependent DNA helicase PcrA